jgi:hypothetical protein
MPIMSEYVQVATATEYVQVATATGYVQMVTATGKVQVATTTWICPGGNVHLDTFVIQNDI